MTGTPLNLPNEETKMSKRAKAVIGAAYGDEGKGLITDFLAAAGATVVARTNGGAQAGHTVVRADGTRHVFSHIGSGAFAGAPTHFTRFFVAHPMFFLDERNRVEALGGNVRASADPRTTVTTPYDIMINQIAEESRGASRHGSCGMGVGETVERCLRPDLAITVGDLHGSRLALVSRLERIRKEWVGERLRTLGIEEVPPRFARLLGDDGVMRRFLDDCSAFADRVVPLPDDLLPDGVLFEGAQGLLLDQDYGAFPHVTRSNTGVMNMAFVARGAGIAEIDAVYVTRTYTTRHGAGPLAHWGEDMSYAEIEDPTNIHNDWQGSLRAAPLDLDILGAAIRHDLGRGEGVAVTASLALTCLDQLGDAATVYADGRKRRISGDGLAAELPRYTGLAVSAVSSGPSRAGVVPCPRL